MGEVMRVEHLSDGVTLYCGDCREVLPTLGKVDVVVTDPPYGIGHVRSGGGGQGGASSVSFTRRANEPVYGDDAPFDPSPLLAFDNVIMWGVDHFCTRLPPDAGRWLAWNKLGEMEQFDSFSDVEFAWHSKRGASRIHNYMWKGICSVKAGEDRKRSHPTQKPIGLMMWCIQQSKCPDGGLILDPYMGSGTTGVAAVRTAHKFIGIEIDGGHFDVACRRISAELQQPRLLVAAE